MQLVMKRTVKLTYYPGNVGKKNLFKVLYMQVKGIKGKFKSNLWKFREVKEKKEKTNEDNVN